MDGTQRRAHPDHSHRQPPRPERLVELMFAKEEGARGRCRACSPSACANPCAKWSSASEAVGIDVVSDGEMSKPSYATYVTERLTGFGGKSGAAQAERHPRASQRREPLLQRPRRAAPQHEPARVQRSGGPQGHGRGRRRHRELQARAR